MNRPVENGMVIGLAAALGQNNGGRLTAEEVERQQIDALCDPDAFCDHVGAMAMRAGSGSCASEAERAMRSAHRLEDAPLHVLLSGVLLAAHLGYDDADVAAVARKLAARYLKEAV